MNPRLQRLIEELRKQKADTEIVKPTEAREDSEKESPSLILVPYFDLPQEDEFSRYF